MLLTKNENIRIIAYHEPFFNKLIDNAGKLFLLEKPFKLITSMLDYLDSVDSREIYHNSNKYLMKHIIFSPSKKLFQI